jgi:hypothetical protein
LTSNVSGAGLTGIYLTWLIVTGFTTLVTIGTKCSSFTLITTVGSTFFLYVFTFFLNTPLYDFGIVFAGI